MGQADFGKLELNKRNHGGNCQRLSVINLKHDQFERSLKQSQKFSDLRAFVVNGLGCYYSSPIQRFYGNSFKASQLQSTHASTVRGLLFSELIAAFAAKHFIFFLSPILLKLEKEENHLMIGRRRV